MTKKIRKTRIIRDNCPELKSAGCEAVQNVTTLKECIEPEIFGEKPVTPDTVRKQRGTKHIPGERRTNRHEQNPVIYDIVHGVRIRPSLTAKEVVHKDVEDEAASLLQDKAEKIYKSNQIKPLGRSYAHNITFPDHMQEKEFRFGVGSTRGESASTLVHGNLTTTSETERKRYILSHGNYDPGEQRDRNYDWSTFSRDKMFGVPTKHESNGAKVRESLQWKTEMARARRTILVPKCVDDFRSKTQCEIGKVHDPLSDTLNVDKGHIFGVPIAPATYNAADLIRRTYLDPNEDGPDDIPVKINRSSYPKAATSAQTKAFGVPTVRTDIEPTSIRRYDPNPDLKLPKIRSIADTQNYGDGSTATGLLTCPYSSAGQAAYFEAPRTKDELKGIYTSVGLSERDFERTWNVVAPEAAPANLSIAKFRKELKSAS